MSAAAARLSPSCTWLPFALCSESSLTQQNDPGQTLSWDEANPGSCGLQDGQHGRGPPEVEQSASVGGNVLVGAGAEAEEVAEFIVGLAEPSRRSRAFEAPHGSIAAFDAAVILLQPVVPVGTGPVPHAFAQRGADRPGVAVVAICCDPVRREAGHRFGGAEERLG